MLKHFKSVFASRNASLMLIASIASMFGDWAYFIALTVYLADHRRLELLATITTFRFACTFVLGPIGGTIVERGSKKSIMIAMDLVRLILMLAMGAAMQFTEVRFWPIALLAIASSVASCLFTPARRALLPVTVDAEHRTALNALDGSIGTFTLMLAPALAGMIMIWSDPYCVVILNGASFLFSALLLSAVRVEAPENRTGSRPRFFNELKEGLAHLVKGREVFAVTLLAFINHIAVGATWIFVPLISLKLGLASSGTGYLSSAIGAGSVLGMLLGGTTAKRGEMRMAFLAVLGFSGSLCLWAPLYASFTGAFGGALLMGFTANLFEAPCWSLLQSKTEQALYARVFSGFDAFTLIGMALGTQLAAIAAIRMPLGGAIVSVGGLMIFVYAFNLLLYWRRRS